MDILRRHVDNSAHSGETKICTEFMATFEICTQHFYGNGIFFRIDNMEIY